LPTILDKPLKFLEQNKDMAVILGIVGIVVMMIIPLPVFLIDILLALMISISLLVLMTSMYLDNVLDFSVFPGLLLVVSLFRISLNIATTRLILSEGRAGEVVNSFGRFVTGDNIVVGVVIFVILLVVQFSVITKGSGRIAEVAARFTLDAMPGKQMAVDADLNAGIITEEEAKQRRRDISREADFYGAMDGASKFVRGDAVAGLFITVINIIGGVIAGKFLMGMTDYGEIVERYTKLTIGDGLASAMPSLMISTASGIIVTRAASKSNLGDELTAQFTQSVPAMALSAGVMAFLGVVPGMPTIPFLALASILGYGAYAMSRKSKADAAEKEAASAKESEAASRPEVPEEKPEDYLKVDQMEMELGYGLIPLVDKTQGGDLLERITMLRRQMAAELGLLVPPIRIRDNIQLQPSEYRIKIKGVEVGRGELMAGSYLAMDPGVVSQRISGIPTVEPAFGLPALWITESQKESAELAGYTVVELPAVVATHLTELIKRSAAEILTRQDVKTLVDAVKTHSPAVVEELIPHLLGLGDVQSILSNLLREGISIRDLGSILESMADAARVSKDTVYVTEQCRLGLSRQICKGVQASDGKVHALVLHPELEQVLEASVQATDRGPRLVLRPELVGRLLDAVTIPLEKLRSLGNPPALVCSPNVRFPLRKLLESSHPSLHVLAYSEIATGVDIRSAGTIILGEGGK